MNKLKGPFLQLVILSISVLLIVVAAGTVWITWNKYKNKISEQAILKEFYAHVKNNPNIIVRRFQLWEGKGIADIDIKGKGLANIWYGKDSVPVISSIGGYSTSYECFYVDNNNNKKEYAYTVELDLRNGSDFNRWFPLGVNSLQDLASNYDSITAILKTFPVSQL